MIVTSREEVPATAHKLLPGDQSRQQQDDTTQGKIPAGKKILGNGLVIVYPDSRPHLSGVRFFFPATFFWLRRCVGEEITRDGARSSGLRPFTEKINRGYAPVHQNSTQANLSPAASGLVRDDPNKASGPETPVILVPE
jgi:hypothetical protein